MGSVSARSSLLALVLGVGAITGCGTGDGGADDTIAPVTPLPTIAGVGAVPAVPSAVRDPIVAVRPPVNDDGTEAALIADVADGNRVLMIGDSILASTSSRYGDHMCNAVVPLGWEVAIEAEPSRFVDFGNRVLRRLLPDDVTPGNDWDAVVVFLGSNYRGDQLTFAIELEAMLDRLAPRPVLLFTVTEYRPNYVEVNEVVNRLGAERENVTVLDWGSITESPGILSSDRLHPTDTGRQVLAESVAAALGPADGDGECLRPTFRDDSAVDGDSSTVLGRSSSGSSSSSGSGSGSSSSGSSGSGSSGSGSSGATPSTVSPTTPATTTPTTATTAPSGGDGDSDSDSTVPAPDGEGVTPPDPVPPPEDPSPEDPPPEDPPPSDSPPSDSAPADPALATDP